MRVLVALCALASLTACTVALGIGRPTTVEADLRVSMTPSASETPEWFTFEITVTNDAVDDVHDGQVSIRLPDTSRFGVVSPECHPSGSSAFCDLPVLAAGGTHRLTLSALPADGTIVATASAADDIELANNQATLPMMGGVDVEVLPLLDGITPVVGAGVLKTYTFRVTNHGPGVAKQVNLVVTASRGFEPLNFSTQYWSCAGLTCTLPELYGNANSVTWRARTPTAGGGTIYVQGTVSTSTAELMPGNNTTRYEQTLTVSADLSITMSATPDPVSPGGTLTYALDVRNNGPSAVAMATVTVTVPTGTMFVSGSGAGWSCTAAGTQVTCQRGPVLDVGSAPISIVVTAPTTPGSITSTAMVTSNLDGMLGNNSASITTTVQ